MSKLLPSEMEVLLWLDKSEKAVLARLDRHYRDAMKDIEMKISSMLGRNDANLPHVIRRIEYQRMLKEQIQTVLERLHSNEYETISQYLTDSYTDAFVGTMYTLHEQDVPLILPIDQSVVMKAVTLDSKLKESLYTTMGKDMTALKKTVAEEVTRGIATGQMYSEIARNIRYAAGIPLRRAKTIARTEASRVQEQATFDAATEAKASGADVVKQWSSRRDGQTRDTHRMLDGQVREVDEAFTVNGKKAMHPHGFGVAELDINCRCTMLTRARAALDEDELKKLRERAVQHSLHVGDPKAFRKEKLPPLKNFAEFKKSYTKAAEEVAKTAADKGKATNRKEAYDILKNGIGFFDVSKSLDYIEEETIIVQANQLYKLNQKFGAIGDDFGGYIGAENSKQFAACIRGSFKSAASQNLVYSFDDYAHGNDFLRQRVKKSIVSGWNMPCLEENYLVYTTTHEYGHILLNKTMSERIDLDDFWEKYRKAVGNASPSGVKKGEKLIQKTSDECAKSIFMEILDIAKEKNQDFSLRANISDYGKTSYQEAFAEVFANSQLGKPNELGDAMNVWLERNGF